MPYLETATRSKDKTVKKYKPKVKKFFSEQTSRILYRYNEYFNLPKAAGDGTIQPKDIDILLNYLIPEIENSYLGETINPMHTSGIQKSIEDVNKVSGSSVSSALTNSQVNLGLQSLAIRVSRINAVTKEILREILTIGVEEGLNIFQIANEIQDTGIDEFYAGRSLTIARTETRIAYDLGGRIAYKELGVEKFDVVGCVGTLAGSNDFGYSAAYGDFSESIGSCGVIEVPMSLWDATSGTHHPNHSGVQVASVIPI